MMMDYILDELLATEIPRDKICFEVTETAAVTSLTDAMEVIAELKERGFKFALHDFGTGLSSYAYLKKMPVDYLKIDGAFISSIAEYVENEAIQQKLIDIGVDYMQGFHIEKPMPLDNLLKVVSLV